MYAKFLICLTVICSALAYLIADEFSDNDSTLITASREDEDPTDMPKDAVMWDYDDTISRLASAGPDCNHKLVQRDPESIQLDTVVLDDLEYIPDRNSFFNNAGDETFINQGGSGNPYKEALNEGPRNDNACPTRGNDNDRRPVLQNSQHTDSHKPPLRLCPPGQHTLCCDIESAVPNHLKPRNLRHPFLMSKRQAQDGKTNFEDCVNFKVDAKHKYCDYTPQCCEDFTVKQRGVGSATGCKATDKQIIRIHHGSTQ